MNKQKRLLLRSQRGASLVEVLVAMLVTTVGLLGFALLQSRAMNSTEDAYLRSQATTLAQDMMERMRTNGVSQVQQSDVANSPGVAEFVKSSNWTGTAPSADCLGASKKCSLAQMALYDIAQVRTAVESSLPSGSIFVKACAADANQLCVYVAWSEETASTCAAANGLSGGLSMPQCVVIQGT